MTGWVMLKASYIQRKPVNDERICGDSQHVVDDGWIVLKKVTGIILILEESDLQKNHFQAKRKMKIELLSAPYEILFVKLRSRRRNYKQSAMKITGQFDRDPFETVTIKMEREDARLVCEVLNRLGL